MGTGTSTACIFFIVFGTTVLVSVLMLVVRFGTGSEVDCVFVHCYPHKK